MESPVSAVLHNGVIFLAEQMGKKRRLKRWKAPPIQCAGDVLAYAREKKIHRLWICPDSDLSTFVREQRENFLQAPLVSELHVHEQDNTSMYEDEVKLLPTCITAFYATRGKMDLSWGQIVIPEYDGRWVTLCYLDDPALLCITLYYLEHVMHMAVRSAPATTGRAWMQREGRKRPTWYREADLSALPDVGSPPLYWKRPLTAEEAGKKYVYVYDKRSQHVDACTDTVLGVGTPRHVMRPEYTRRCAGLYHIKVRGEGVWNGTRLPPALPDPMEEQWVWGPLVAVAYDAGYDVEVLEGYVWDQSHRVLAGWAKQVLTARKALEMEVEEYPYEAARKAALKELKMIGVAGIGLLNAQPDDWRGAEVWYRPDWYRTIVATARTRLMYGVLRREQLGYFPVMVVADSVAYLSDNPDPETAVPELLKKGFALKYRLPLASHLAVFEPECSVAQANRLLNEAARLQQEDLDVKETTEDD